VKLVDIEAATLLSLIHQHVLPACLRYQAQLANSVNHVSFLDNPALSVQKEYLHGYSTQLSELIERTRSLERSLHEVRDEHDHDKRAHRSASELIPAMVAVREVADSLETKTERALWPLPTYFELLFHH
jgi:glutamine synthetase